MPVKRAASVVVIALTLVPSISTNQSAAPVPAAGISGRRSRELRVALDQMHRDDAVEIARVELCVQRRAQRIFLTSFGAQANDAEHGAAAVAAADR